MIVMSTGTEIRCKEICFNLKHALGLIPNPTESDVQDGLNFHTLIGTALSQKMYLSSCLHLLLWIKMFSHSGVILLVRLVASKLKL